ncbi:MAG TPA: Dabb family protein [Acidimicrobiia bacterium]|nr:Dabb family protein [Acidimicrobiia bacterium]
MITHAVVFRFHDSTSPEAVDRLSNALDTLPIAIPEIVTLHHGRDLDLVEGSWDYGLVATFASTTDYQAYGSHPAHLEVISDAVTTILANLARVQFSSPVAS